MDLNSIDPALEVSSESCGSIIEGFKAFRSVALKIIVAHHGLPSMGKIRKGEWYPLRAWIDVFYAIQREVGPSVLHDIGESVPRNAFFPPQIDDIYKAIQSIDVAYHMNHRKNGVVMFDPDTGKMLEGIGHYGFQPVAGERKIIAVNDNPYPCTFDHGITTAMARRFQPHAAVVHDDTRPCRGKGGATCTYVVTW